MTNGRNVVGEQIPAPFSGCLSKRLLDILLGTTLLIVAIPVLLVAMAVACISSRGSALFLQTRRGLAGNRFRIFKLRTMRRGNQRRREVTAVGRWLRATSADELPQLFNVLRGEMSLVGPRPHPIILDLKYWEAIPDLRLRYAMKPGITGLAQINGARGPVHSAEDIRRRLSFDLAYMRQWSVILDLRIIVLTPLRGVLPVLWRSLQRLT